MLSRELDVTMATYNSAKTLPQCLQALREHLPRRRLIAVDHCSTDNTQKILTKYDAEIYEEDQGLGYARTLQIKLAETDPFIIIDSDVVVQQGICTWLSHVLSEFSRDDHLGGYVGCPSLEAQYFAHFWRRLMPKLLDRNFTLHFTVLSKASLAKADIPPHLQAAEDYAIMQSLTRAGYRVHSSPAPIKHLGQHHTIKTGLYAGANFRLASRTPTETVTLFVWKGLLHPVKLVPFMVATRKSDVTIDHLKYTIQWMKGFTNPNKYFKATREGVQYAA